MLIIWREGFGTYPFLPSLRHVAVPSFLFLLEELWDINIAIVRWHIVWVAIRWPRPCFSGCHRHQQGKVRRFNYVRRIASWTVECLASLKDVARPPSLCTAPAFPLSASRSGCKATKSLGWNVFGNLCID